MKIVVIGGSGLIGTKLVARLRERGHEVLPASPNSGVDTVTGEGLSAALAGADIVADVANSPSFEEKAALDFFTASGRNLLAAEAATGVRHHVALSVVGTDRLQGIGYFRGKIAQERLIVGSGVPYTILRATQFFEFMGGIAQSATQGEEVRLSTALFQPMAADDVAATLAAVTLAPPANSILEVAGPEVGRIDQFVGRWLSVTLDPRRVVSDKQATYFGLPVERQLLPGAGARIAPTRFEDWLSHAAIPALA